MSIRRKESESWTNFLDQHLELTVILPHSIALDMMGVQATEVIKKLMLNSTKNEILTAHKK